MIAALILISFLVLISGLNRTILKNNYKIMNHVSIAVWLWIITITFHAMMFGNNGEDHFTVYTLIGLSIFSLSIGFWFTGRAVLKGENWRNYAYDIQYLSKITNVFIALEILRVFYMGYIVLRLAGGINTFLFSNTYVRLLYLDRGGGLFSSFVEFFLNANGYVGHVLIGLLIANKGSKWKIKSILWIILEVLFAIITMSKMSLIISITVILITVLNNIGSVKIQSRVLRTYIPFIGFGVFVFLLVIAMQRNYSATQSNYGSTLYEIVFKKGIIYLTGGTEGFSIFVKDNVSPFSAGSSTFSFLSRILSTIGLSSQEKIRFSEFVMTSEGTTNVYTWLRPFYLDFSYAGVIFFPMLLGIVFGLFYNPKRHNLFLDIGCSWTSTVVAMSFYSFIFKQTVYIFVIVYGYVLHRLLRKRLYITNNN